MRLIDGYSLINFIYLFIFNFGVKYDLHVLFVRFTHAARQTLTETRCSRQMHVKAVFAGVELNRLQKHSRLTRLWSLITSRRLTALEPWRAIVRAN